MRQNSRKLSATFATTVMQEGSIDLVDNRIRSLREARGLSLESLADKIGTTNQQVSLLETGRRRLTVDWLVRLAEGLKCHPWELVGGSIPPEMSSLDFRLLEHFRVLNELQQHTLLAFLESIAKPSFKSRRAKTRDS